MRNDLPTWEYFSSIDEVTGEKDDKKEGVIASADVKGTSWMAGLYVFCSGTFSFTVRDFVYRTWDVGKCSVEQVPLDRIFGSAAEGFWITELKLKFDNNEPGIIGCEVGSKNLGICGIPPYPKVPKDVDNIRKEVIKRMIEHSHLEIEFRVKARSYVVEFDLTGFSRELAKCSKIPDTN